jgi:hypothetical protein
LTNARRGRPVAAFILSIVGGILIFLAGASRPFVVGAAFNSGSPFLFRLYYNVILDLNFQSGFNYDSSIIGTVSGIVIIVASIATLVHPRRASEWGVVVLVFSFVSLIGLGGFFFGAVLSILGGAVALVWTKGPHGPREASIPPALIERGQ